MRSWFHKVLLTKRGYQLAYWAPTAPYAQCLGLCYNLNEQIFASIMHGCPELSKGALGQNVHLQELELSKICSWFHRILLTERGYQLAHRAPTTPYAQCLGLCYKLNKQIFTSIMHGCPELGKGALGQNAQLPNQSLHFQRYPHGFIEYYLLSEDTNLHVCVITSVPKKDTKDSRVLLLTLASFSLEQTLK